MQVKVRQIIDRKIEAQGMIDYSIDESDSRVIIYVGKEQDLKNIHITSLALGGAYGEVTPDPTTVKDFTSPRKFTVQYAWSKPNEGTIWTVYVQLTDEDGGSKPSTGDLSVNAWVNMRMWKEKYRIPIARLNIRDKVKVLGVRSQRHVDGTKASAKIEGLQSGTTYQCRLVNASGSVLGESTFTTEEATALYNGNFDLWYQAGKTWYTGESGKSFWDTSNPGTTQGLGAAVNINPTQGNTNVVHTQGGKSAELKSQFKVKFAAASLYTGSFGELVGMNGAKINFGQLFTSRPTALHGFFQYAPATVGYVGDNQPTGTIAKGDPDVCSIYIALAKKSYTVDNTKVETFIQFKTDNNIIAYGELPLKECVSTNGTWKEFTIDLEYKTLEKPMICILS